MKTIVINNNQKEMIKEGILIDSLPNILMDEILNNKTSLKKNSAIPEIYEGGFLATIIRDRFENTKNELRKIGKINDVSETTAEKALTELIVRCQEEERPYRNALEKVCFNYIINFFGVPDDMIQLDLSLVDNVDIASHCIQLDPVKDEDIEYDSIEDITTSEEDISKRRLLNILSMGAGMQISSNIKSYLSEIYEINPKLPELYHKILALNNYLLFTKKFELTEDNKRQFGTVLVSLHHKDEKVDITAQGKIFPVLLSEGIRGFMELFASHGLPKEQDKANNILSRADYLKSEPWDMRIGPSLWNLLSDSFGDVDSTLIPYLYKVIAKLSPKHFNILMSEVFAKTKRGKNLIEVLTLRAKEEKEYDGFEDKMNNLKVNKSLLSDEINPEEL